MFWDLFLFRVILQYILLHISLCTCGKVSQVELIGKYFLIFTKCVITGILNATPKHLFIFPFHSKSCDPPPSSLRHPCSPASRPTDALSAPDPNSGTLPSSPPAPWSSHNTEDPLFPPHPPIRTPHSILTLVSSSSKPFLLRAPQISAPRDSSSLSYTPSRGLPQFYRIQLQNVPLFPPVSRTHLSHGEPLSSSRTFPQVFLGPPPTSRWL